MAWSFQGPVLNWKPSSSPPRVASLEQKTLLSPRKSRTFQEPCVSNQVKDQILEQEMLLVLLLGKLQVLEALCQEPGAKTNTCIFYYLTPLLDPHIPESWILEKQPYIRCWFTAYTDFQRMLPQPATFWYPAGAITESSKCHSIILPGQLLQDDGKHNMTSEFHQHGPTVALTLLWSEFPDQK